MQLFHLISITVPLALLYIVPKVTGDSLSYVQKKWPLYLACVLFFISWYLPSPLIDGQDTSFVTHFVGGGVFSAFLWHYIKRARRLKLSLIYDLGGLFALVSALGAINELFELMLVQFQIADILISDTSWDILANSLGALTGYSTISLILYLSTSSMQQQDQD